MIFRISLPESNRDKDWIPAFAGTTNVTLRLRYGPPIGALTGNKGSFMADGKYYKDVREHLNALDERGKLVRVKKQINKDTQLMPLVRWQFRGLQEHQRKAFLFENVIDVRGKRYDMPVAVGTLAASTEIYGIGLNCAPDQ